MSLTLVKNVALFLLEHGLKAILGGLSLLLVVNYLSPTEFGYYTLCLSAFLFTSAICGVGLDSVLLRDFLVETNTRSLVTSIHVRLFFAVLIFMLVVMVRVLSNLQWLDLLLLLQIGLFFDAFRGVREKAFSREKYKLIVTANTLGALIQLVAVAACVHLSAPMLYLGLGTVLNRFVVIVVLLAGGGYMPKLSRLNAVSHRERTDLAQRGYPLMITALAGITYAMQDQWIIAAFLGIQEVGVYGAGTKFVVLALVLPTIITNLLYKKIIRLEGSPQFPKYVQALFARIFFVGLITFILVSSISGVLVSLFFPPAYERAADVLALYSAVFLFAFFQSLNNKILVLRDLQGYIMRRTLLGLVANFLLGIFLVPKFGIIGAVWATITSEMIIFVSYYFSSKTRDVFFMQVTGVLRAGRLSFGVTNA